MNTGEIKQYIKSYIESGQFQEAMTTINQCKKIYSYDDEIASMEAIIKILEGNYDRAMECIQDGLKINIFNSDLYFSMGNIYEAQGKANNAYLCYEHALALNKENQEIITETIRNLKTNNNVTVKNYSIILLTHNKLDYTKVCIDSIRKYNGNDGCEVVVVDNNSSDGTRAWLQEQNDIKFILNDENRGFPGGCNQGIEIADKENDIFLLNNDTVIMPNSIFNLRMGLYSDEKVGATGSVSNNVSNYQQITEQFTDFDGYINFAQENNITNIKSYENRIKLVGFAMLIKRQALDKVGLLDERFFPGNFEDDDLSMRIILAGYEILLCKDSYIHHFGSTTFKDKAEEYEKLLKVNSQKFKEKWGFVSEYSIGVRYDLISFINCEENKEINVLEVGCACGCTLQAIKNKYPNANVYGIEINDSAAEVAKMVADVRNVNIETSEVPYEEKMFDYIILGDVLEHLYDPEKVILNLKKYLKSNGFFLVSLPNVMNYTVLFDLINGNWTYTDQGILDRTHLRFFTKKEIEKMFDRTGLKIFDTKVSKYMTSEAIEEYISELTNMSLLKDSEQYRIAQYMMKVGNVIQDDEVLIRLLRRIEFDVEVESTKKELVNLLDTKDISIEVIIDSIAKQIINKVLVLNTVAIECFNNQMYDYVIPLLKAAYDLDNTNIDTNYNLAYILNLTGNKALALDYLNKLDTDNSDIKSLIKEIEK